MKRGSKSVFIATGGILMALTVTAGALGAHALQAVLSEVQLSSFETGVRYQAWHALAIIIIQCLPANVIGENSRKGITRLMVAGIIFFSFSIYLLNTRHLIGLEGIAPVIGPVTPLGGLCLIAAWVWLGGAVWSQSRGSLS